MTKYTTRPDPVYGHQILDPMPTATELEAFYRDTYYKLIDEGKRAVNIARERKGGDEADDQAKWFKETLHRDVIDLLKEHATGPEVLEVGCGLGILLDHLAEAGLKPSGLDLATAAVEVVREKGYPAFDGSFESRVDDGTIKAGSYDGVVFIQVLEQTFDPVANLKAAFKALKPGGVVVVRSANDFNALEMAAHERMQIPQWWISGPEHIHYLTYDAMERMMHAAGLEPIARQSDFPMEMFILMGMDYVSDRSLGAECHKRRVAFERNLPVDARRKLYKAFADAGLGRCMLITARKPL